MAVVAEAMDNRSRLFRSDGVFDLDSLINWEELDFNEFWPSNERPPDPKAWVIRQVIANHLKPTHQEVIEQFFFQDKSVSEIAADRRVTRRAVRSMLDRALESLRWALRKHALEYKDVPENEW